MTYDFRKHYNATTPRRQGVCGGCGSFAVASTLSDRLRMTDPNLPELSCGLPLIGDTGKHEVLVRTDAPNSISAQEKLSQISGVSGCNGTTLRQAWRYLWVFGTPSDTQLPIETIIRYYERNGRLPHIQTMLGKTTTQGMDGKVLQVYRPLSVYNVPPERIAEEILLRGPVTAAFYAPQSFYDWNGHGVYECKSAPMKTRTAHAVRLVGYTPTSWIAANSWGDQWGDGGYFQIARNCPECQVEAFVQGVNIDGRQAAPHPTDQYPPLWYQARMRWTVFADLNDEPKLRIPVRRQRMRQLLGTPMPNSLTITLVTLGLALILVSAFMFRDKK